MKDQDWSWLPVPVSVLLPLSLGAQSLTTRRDVNIVTVTTCNQRIVTCREHIRTRDHGVLTRDMETLEAVMTPASHPEAVTEVNNNETLAQKQQVKEAAEAEGTWSQSPSEPESSSQTPEASRTISVSDPEEWLCVAKLPPSTDHNTFLDLLSEFGGVKESFLLVSSKTGE